jgi:hypothetical protein
VDLPIIGPLTLPIKCEIGLSFAKWPQDTFILILFGCMVDDCVKSLL